MSRRNIQHPPAAGKGTLDQRLRRILAASTAGGLLPTPLLLSLVRLAAGVSAIASAAVVLIIFILFYMYFSDAIAAMRQNTLPTSYSVPDFIYIISFEFVVFVGIALFGLIRTVLITINIRRFYQQEYLGTWSLLYHRALGPELAGEDYWRPLYRKPSLFHPLKFPAFSRSLEQHLLFLAAFLDALRDIASGPNQVHYVHFIAGYTRLQRICMRRALWIILLLYPLLIAIPLGFIPIKISLGWIVSGYCGFLVLMVCAILATDGVIELQMRARLRALCEFFLDAGGPELRQLPPPPRIFGSRLRQGWVRLVERIARNLNWRGGIEA